MHSSTTQHLDKGDSKIPCREFFLGLGFWCVQCLFSLLFQKKLCTIVFISRLLQKYYFKDILTFVKRVKSLNQLRSLEAFVSMQHTGEAQHHPLSQGQGRIICVNAASCAEETTNLECRSMRHTSQCSY